MKKKILQSVFEIKANPKIPLHPKSATHSRMLPLQVPFEPSKSVDSHVVVGLLVKLLNLKELKLLGRANKHFVSSVRPHVRELSAAQMQCLWRRCGWRVNTNNLAKTFLAAKLSEADARAFQFEEIVQHLRKKCVVKIALVFLRRIVYASADIIKISLKDKKYNVRVFLAGYMIKYFPEHVFESLGVSERDLIAAASPLLEVVLSIAGTLAEHCPFRDLPLHLAESFLPLVSAYEEAFKTWKKPDHEKLVSRMVNATRALLVAFPLLDPYNPLDEPMRQEFRQQIRRMFTKFVDIGAAAELQQFERFKVGTLSYETFNPANPIDWELWANYHAENVIAMLSDEYWALWANERMTRHLF